MFIMTNGCNETVTDGTVAGLAITLFPDTDASMAVDLLTDALFDVDGCEFAVAAATLLVDASPIVLSVSISIFSLDAVTGILLNLHTLWIFKMHFSRFVAKIGNLVFCVLFECCRCFFSVSCFR